MPALGGLCCGLVEFVVDMVNRTVPAGAAIVTVPAATGLRMAVACCAGRYSRRCHTWQRVHVRRWSVDHVSAETHTKIGGNHVAQFEPVFDNFVLTRWQPMPRAWRCQTDLNDQLEVLNGLQIARVVPAMPIYFRKQEREAVNVHSAERVIVERLLYAI